MTDHPFVTKKELIQELGISKSTFYRRLRALHISTTGHLLSLKQAKQIRRALGCSFEEPQGAE